MRIRWLISALSALAVARFSLAQTFDSQLGSATNGLFMGRSYLVGFPKNKTRNQLRSAYLGLDSNGSPVAGAALQPVLEQAVADAISARLSPQAGPTGSELAQKTAWEALEALLNGQLLVGNASLLDGLRVGFPVATKVAIVI
jgi:hypothetical protein